MEVARKSCSGYPLSIATLNMAPTTRTPEAEGLDVVVLGRFNPAIFHPEWFLHQKLVEEEDARAATVNMVTNEFVDVVLCGVKLFCLPDRFSLSSSNISHAARIQDLLVQIFRLLPHTPITACGINPSAHFAVSSADYWHKIGHTLAPKDLIWDGLFKNPGMRSLTIKGQREGEFASEFNITVEPSTKFSPAIYVRSNCHYALPVASVHAAGAEMLLRFVEREWNPACEMARLVANTILDKISPQND